MARDFAKLEAPSRSKKSKKESNSALPLILGIIVIAGLCFAAGFWLGGKQNSQPVAAADSVSASDLAEAQRALQEQAAAAQLLQVEIERLQDQVAIWKQKAGADAHTKVGALNFYQELPEQSVMPSPVHDSNPAKARPMDRSLDIDAPIPAPKEHSESSSVSGKSYRVQLASFKTRDEASSLQHKLMKAGFTAFIHSVNLPERGQWFRVYAGPYPNKDMAKSAVREIQAKMKIRGLLLSDG